MLIFLSGVITLWIAYSSLIYWIWKGFRQGQNHQLSPAESFPPSISIVIAARNEASGIQKCVSSILNNDFPSHLFEIIIIDDHSTDQTYDLAASFQSANLKVFRLPDGITGKKAAIQFGVNQTKNEIILCTDADCEVEKSWISSHLHAYKNENLAFCTGIVLPKQLGPTLFNFQWLDFASTMVITANGIFRKQYYLANGANMSFRKSAFLAIRGFEQNKDRASGDDIFLIQNLANQHGIGFISSPFSKVCTKSEATWKDFFVQRKRWATKALASPDKNVMKIQGFVLLYALFTLLMLPLMFFECYLFGAALAILVLGKMLTDFFFLSQVTTHFRKPEVMSSFLTSFFIYYVHILYSGWNATFPSKYAWKSRTTK
jgi:biofilm PGA synthesis N-glycosyltransferase PgaC